MAPFHAPLPTAWYFVFQLSAGSQTSILMSESLDGFAVSATRQNAGRSANALPPRPARPPGCVNAPAATSCAESIVAPGSVSDFRLSQVAACAADGSRIKKASPETRAPSPDRFP